MDEEVEGIGDYEPEGGEDGLVENQQQIQEELVHFGQTADAVRHWLDVLNSDPHHQDVQHVLEKTCDLIELLCTVLSRDTNPYRLQLLIFNTAPHLFQTLFGYITELVDPKFGKLRSMVFQALTKIVSLCSDDRASTEQDIDLQMTETRTALAHECCRRFLEQDAVSVLFQFISGHGQQPVNEELKIVAIELIFVFVMRNEAGKGAVVSEQGIPQLLACLPHESSPMVRNYICALLRELANQYYGQLIQYNCSSITVQLIRGDPSPDVRALSAEMLDVIFKHAAPSFLKFPAKKELAEVLKMRLEKDKNSDVLSAIFQLLETIFTIEAHTVQDYNPNQPSFTDRFVMTEGYRALLRCLNRPTKTACLAARTLRFFVQLCPPRHNIGHVLVTHYDSLSVLLKTAFGPAGGPNQPADQNQPPKNKTAILQQVLRVEVAITVGLILSMNPNSRTWINKELREYPLWLSTIRQSLCQSLKSANVDYYSDIRIVDATGIHINDMMGVTWVDDRHPSPQAIRDLFAQQENRMFEIERNPRKIVVTGPYPCEVEDSEKTARLTFAILHFGVELALTDTGSPTPQQHQHPQLQQGQFQQPSATTSGAPPWTSSTSSTSALSGHEQPGGGKGLPAGQGSPPWETSPREHMMSATSSNTGPAEAGGSIGKGELRRQSGGSELGLGTKPPSSTPFDNTFLLCVGFAQYYSKRENPKARYKKTPDGFMIRQVTNPWQPHVNQNKIRRWTVTDLKHGDLFEFDIPYTDIKAESLDIWLNKCRRHFTYIHKLWVTTPNTVKTRRWFLYDMMHNVMPKIQDLFSQLLALIDTHGDEVVSWVIQMFREKEIQAGEQSIHPGNFVDVVDQLHFFFSQNNSSTFINTNEKIRNLNAGMNKLQLKDAHHAPEDEEDPPRTP
eukprot:TRINITY_DN7569_c0_g1_i1.p1 TRINITY_DN7569_c0_g1~~TRINITY_DN7569_c0_g1_i1.p1  ORF type:complete len:902 (+),score=96.71 TRINITY_DN7569_c0_g1_i1:41-2746(+)